MNFYFIILSAFSQSKGKNIIYWNAAMEISLDDFTIVPDNSQRIKDNNLALTRTGITYALTTKPGTKTFDIKIYATMHKANSFIREGVLNAPIGSINYLLNHEKKHFDISEVFAREAVKVIMGRSFTKNHVKEIGMLMQKLFRQSEAMQDLYDKETSNGSNAKAQKEWNDKIDQLLYSLRAYDNKSLVKRYK